MEEKTYVVYRHTNLINNKVYIGITCQKPSVRFGKDGRGYMECPYFWKAIQKYGWDNFKHEILISGQTCEEACEKEIQLIRSFHSNDKDYGYNLSKGGDKGTMELLNNKWDNDPEYREEMSYKMREAWKDPEKRKRRSEAAKKRWANPDFKKFVTQRVTEACCRSVMCIETGKTYSVMRDGALEYHTNISNIARSCKQGYRAGGVHWKYVDDDVSNE